MIVRYAIKPPINPYSNLKTMPERYCKKYLQEMPNFFLKKFNIVIDSTQKISIPQKPIFKIQNRYHPPQKKKRKKGLKTSHSPTIKKIEPFRNPNATTEKTLSFSETKFTEKMMKNTRRGAYLVKNTWCSEYSIEGIEI